MLPNSDLTGTPETMQQECDFALVLRPVPGNWHTPPAQRLRLTLKVSLRGFGLRAIACRPQPRQREADRA